ncbi:hypothetical protein BDV12DRAFT_208410 [Aspergillus spectabilis]
MSLLKTSAAIFILSTLSQAQDLPDTIVGCNDLECPLNDTYKCHLDDTTYSNVGLARIVDPQSALEGISILKAYLGIPEDINTDNISGCAVIFNYSPGEFEGGDEESAVGSCSDLIEESCIDALVQRGADIGDGNCNSFERELRQNAIEECADFAGQGHGLGNFTLSSLADSTTFAGVQNGSSDCWPVSPKADGLALFDEEITFSDFTDAESTNQLYKVTPILTVFPRNTDDGFSAQLTCLKAVEVIDDENSEG